MTNFVPSSPNLVTLLMEALRSSETSVLEPHDVASQNTAFCIAFRDVAVFNYVLLRIWKVSFSAY
jgi:hypothetical protein